MMESLPCVSACCPACGLTFAEVVDAESFAAEEIRAVQCGANALRVAANRVGSYDDRREMELMADRIDAMLDRLGGRTVTLPAATRCPDVSQNRRPGDTWRYD